MPEQAEWSKRQIGESIEDWHLRLQRANEERDEMNRKSKMPTGPADKMIISGKAAEIFQNLHPGEPVFVFRAQDLLSVMVLRHYAKLFEGYTTNGVDAHLKAIVDAANDFAGWQRQNPSLVKLPD